MISKKASFWRKQTSGLSKKTNIHTLWVRILAPDTGCTSFHINFVPANVIGKMCLIISAIYPAYSVVNDDDLVSNDLSLVAPSSDVVAVSAQQENPLPFKPAQPDTPLPFKLTPRGHSAPVIISQVLCRNAFVVALSTNISSSFVDI